MVFKKGGKYILASFFFLLYTSNIFAQQPTVHDPYLLMYASPNDPLFTTYAAAKERSRLYGDKAYKMDYYKDDNPLNYSSDHSGRIFNIWKVNKVVVDEMNEYHKRPHILASFPDMTLLKYQPFKDLVVNETFLVYSSKIAVDEMEINNMGPDTLHISVYPIMEYRDDTLRISSFNNDLNGFQLNHHETNKRLVSDLYKGYPYIFKFTDYFAGNFKPDTYGGYSGTLNQFYTDIKERDSLNMKSTGSVDFVALQKSLTLGPGQTKVIRYIRGTQGVDEEKEPIVDEINDLKTIWLQSFVNANENIFKSIPRIDFNSNDEKLVYLGAFNLVRQNMLPPSGKTKHNFYVFSRNPKWGWGHGHQVLHESLSMLSYAYLDPQSAEESQRVYMEQQGDNGLIAYRHGPRGAQVYEHKGEPTTSAPFYSWINWKIYQVSKDRKFLKDAYSSGVSYVNWLKKHRDDDQDGLFEWGPYGLIENVRDWYNVIFQVTKERHLDVDKDDISDELEDLDLSLMVVNEMRNLSKMASELDKAKESQKWTQEADKTSALINKTMWDDSTNFYYHVDKKTHKFKFQTRNLKRKEIIGFLPLWSKTAPRNRAQKLVSQLTDKKEFWRKYGVPTLSADDSYYSPYVDQCCKWNGPVWLLWDYMVFDGLNNYGYHKLANSLGHKMLKAVTTQLSKNHNYWESFSPDNDILNSPSNYIWDSIMAKVLIDMYQKND